MIEGCRRAVRSLRHRAAHPLRRDLGEEHRDAEAHRDGDEHRDDGGDERAVDRHERAEDCRSPDPTRPSTGTSKPKVWKASRPPQNIEKAAASSETSTNTPAAPTIQRKRAVGADVARGARVEFGGGGQGEWRSCGVGVWQG
jgi:hypothetical protein